MRNIKYENYEEAASNWIEKNIKSNYKYEDNYENRLRIETLKTLICCHFLLQDIDNSNFGRNQWLAFIFIVLVIILIKIW